MQTSLDHTDRQNAILVAAQASYYTIVTNLEEQRNLSSTGVTDSILLCSSLKLTVAFVEPGRNKKYISKWCTAITIKNFLNK